MSSAYPFPIGMLAGFRSAVQLISVQSTDGDCHDKLRKVQGAKQQIAEAELSNRHLFGMLGWDRCRVRKNLGLGGRRVRISGLWVVK
jgi:hypothetical protein